MDQIIKQKLYTLCQEYIANNELQITNSIKDAREAANNDTKSSAGDKYETGREMMQQEIDLNLARLNELTKLKEALKRINPDQVNATVMPGSVVHTSNGNYYIAISAGLLNADGATYYAISPSSPIGTKIAGAKAGDEIVFNNKKIQIIAVS